MKHLILVLTLCLNVWAYQSNFNYMSSEPYGGVSNNNYDYYNGGTFNPFTYNDQTSFGGFQAHDSFEVINYAKGCPNTYQPICASNGVFYMLFNNPCQLETRNDEELLQGRSEYIECPMQLCSHQCRPCPNTYEPVCARDMNTHQFKDFQNYCQMEYAMCSLKKEYRFEYAGNCYQIPQCIQQCPQIYQPVCARYGNQIKEFFNSCELERSSCNHRIEWIVVNHGSCAAAYQAPRTSNALAPLMHYVMKQTPSYAEYMNSNRVEYSVPNYAPRQQHSYSTVNYPPTVNIATNYKPKYSPTISNYLAAIPPNNSYIQPNYMRNGGVADRNHILYKQYEVQTVKPFRLCGTLSKVDNVLQRPIYSNIYSSTMAPITSSSSTSTESTSTSTSTESSSSSSTTESTSTSTTTESTSTSTSTESTSTSSTTESTSSSTSTESSSTSSSTESSSTSTTTQKNCGNTNSGNSSSNCQNTGGGNSGGGNSGGGNSGGGNSGGGNSGGGNSGGGNSGGGNSGGGNSGGGNSGGGNSGGGNSGGGNSGGGNSGGGKPGGGKPGGGNSGGGKPGGGNSGGGGKSNGGGSS